MSVYAFSALVLGCYLSFIGFLAILVNSANKAIDAKSKKKLVNIIKNYKLFPTFHHAFYSYTLLSDNLFGKKLFSIKSTISSILLSLVWIMFLTILCAYFSPGFWNQLKYYLSIEAYLISALYLVVVVIIIDYFSILLTRIIIKFMASRDRGFIFSLFAICVDLIISVTIFYVGISLAKFAIYQYEWGNYINSIYSWVNISEIHSLMVTLNDLHKLPDGTFVTSSGKLETKIMYVFPEGVTFYSSIFTSIWLWTHILTFFIMKYSLRVDYFKNKWVSIFNVNDEPFEFLFLSMTVASVILVLLIISGFTIKTLFS